MNIVDHRGEEVLEHAVLLEKFDGLGAGLEDVGDGHRGNGQHQPKIYIVFSVKNLQKVPQPFEVCYYIYTVLSCTLMYIFLFLSL